MKTGRLNGKTGPTEQEKQPAVTRFMRRAGDRKELSL